MENDWTRKMKTRCFKKIWREITRPFRRIRDRIRWKRIKKDFEQYLTGSESGVTTSKRTPKVIVSLTSYPARIPQIHYTIYSLLNQTVKPDEIILWLAEEQFPGRNADLPDTLLKLIAHGLTIKYCEDIKSYKKLIPAIKEYPGDIIVTVDDDTYYFPNTLELLLSSYEKNMNAVHGHCGHFISFDENGQLENYLDWQHRVPFRKTKPSFRNFLTGVGGILYPPNVFHHDVLREDLFMRLSPTADDIWFWAMAVLNDRKISVVENNISDLMENQSYDSRSGKKLGGLYSMNVREGSNDKQIRQVIEQYPVIMKKLRRE